MKKKRIIFFPSEPGIAHITRSLAIAEVLANRGHTIYFALHKTYRKPMYLKNSKITFLDIKQFMTDKDVARMNVIKNIPYITTLVKEEIKLIKQYNVDLAIIDTRASAFISTRLTKTPQVFITGSGALLEGCHLPNFGFPLFIHKLIYPIVGKIISNKREQLLTPLLQVANNFGESLSLFDLFKHSQIIIPEIPGYLSSANKHLKRHYVGPIHWDGFSSILPDEIKKMKKDGKTIYLTFGGTGYDKKKLIKLAAILAQSGYRVIVSTGVIAHPKEFPTIDNLYVHEYVSGREVAKRVDVMICHGGYGTMTQAIRAGTPVISIPFNPDQFLHGLRMQELGLGICIKTIPFLTILRLNWQTLQRYAENIDPEYIHEHVKEVFHNLDFYTRNVNQYRKKFPKQDGSIEAAKIIESLQGDTLQS